MQYGTNQPCSLKLSSFSKLRMQYGTDKAKNKYLPLISKLRMQYGTSVVTTSKIT